LNVRNASDSSPPAYADIATIAARHLRDTVTAAEDAMRYVDALPTATASRGMIKVALRVSDTAGVDRLTSEFAMSPNIASHLVVALTDAIAEHNGAQACNLYAFSGADLSRRKRKIGDNKADKPSGDR
jgi:hypothetical protein